MSDDRESPIPQDAYVGGVEALLEGRLAEAEEALAPLAEAGHPEAILALAKAQLERGDGSAASGQLAKLLGEPPADPGLHAYLLLLSASAEALQGRGDVALAVLTEASRVDPRMEHAARSLRRRLEKGRPPVLRF